MTILAHIGTGLDGIWAGLLHPFTGLDHLLAMVAVGVLAAVIADRRVAWATPGAFVAGMVGGGVLGIAGVGAGAVEATIALSLVALGGLIAVAAIPSLRLRAWAPALALGFGAIHGIAHGGEVPTSAAPFAYVAGFVAATIALQLSGVALGTTVGRHWAGRTALAGVVSATGIALVAGLPV